MTHAYEVKLELVDLSTLQLGSHVRLTKIPKSGPLNGRKFEQVAVFSFFTTNFLRGFHLFIDFPAPLTA